MNKLIAIASFAATVAAFGAGAALAGTHVTIKDSVTDYHQLPSYKAIFDHPLTTVLPNKNLKVAITDDVIQRSCCIPPQLVVAGKITNVTPAPIDYVKLIFAFEDKDGRVLHTERMFNLKAASLNDDAEVQRLLNEKPHFTPLKPGETDTFAFQVVGSELPRYSKVELMTFEQRE